MTSERLRVNYLSRASLSLPRYPARLGHSSRGYVREYSGLGVKHTDRRVNLQLFYHQPEQPGFLEIDGRRLLEVSYCEVRESLRPFAPGGWDVITEQALGRPSL